MRANEFLFENDEDLNREILTYNICALANALYKDIQISSNRFTIMPLTVYSDDYESIKIATILLTVRRIAGSDFESYKRTKEIFDYIRKTE